MPRRPRRNQPAPVPCPSGCVSCGLSAGPLSRTRRSFGGHAAACHASTSEVFLHSSCSGDDSPSAPPITTASRSRHLPLLARSPAQLCHGRRSLVADAPDTVDQQSQDGYLRGTGSTMCMRIALQTWIFLICLLRSRVVLLASRGRCLQARRVVLEPSS